MAGRVRVMSERMMIPGREAQVRGVMEKVVQRVRQQPGFVKGDVVRDIAKPELYCVWTEWESIKHLDKWLREPEYATLLAEMNSLLGAPTRYDIFHRQKEEIFLL